MVVVARIGEYISIFLVIVFVVFFPEDCRYRHRYTLHPPIHDNLFLRRWQ